MPGLAVPTEVWCIWGVRLTPGPSIGSFQARLGELRDAGYGTGVGRPEAGAVPTPLSPVVPAGSVRCPTFSPTAQTGFLVQGWPWEWAAPCSAEGALEPSQVRLQRVGRRGAEERLEGPGEGGRGRRGRASPQLPSLGTGLTFRGAVLGEVMGGFQG